MEKVTEAKSIFTTIIIYFLIDFKKREKEIDAVPLIDEFIG